MFLHTTRMLSQTFLSMNDLSPNATSLNDAKIPSSMEEPKDRINFGSNIHSQIVLISKPTPTQKDGPRR